MKKINYKSAIILCGGKGTRLGELGKKIPKTLVSTPILRLTKKVILVFLYLLGMLMVFRQ